MNIGLKDTDLLSKIFTTGKDGFCQLALDIFRFQYQHNNVYRQYCDVLNVKPGDISTITRIPFLPIGFFKTHHITTGSFEPAAIFESSGTTQTINSRHYLKDTSIYEQSFLTGFKQFYGDVKDWCILALLPSYLERNNSSLVMMADKLIQLSGHPQSGFYLHDHAKLKNVLEELESKKQKTLLLGVTFALLDLAEAFPMPLQHTIVMETGGMKGRREEMTRQQVHEVLCEAFKIETVHSEYGMTELLSQAYSKEKGIFNTSPWMKVLIREEDDPFAVHDKSEAAVISGALNVIDLANIYSCSFIATEDAGKLYSDGSFEVLGRLDNTDIRGCSLMAV